MIRKIIFSFFYVVLLPMISLGQSTIHGVITDFQTGDTIKCVDIIVYNDDMSCYEKSSSCEVFSFALQKNTKYTVEFDKWDYYFFDTIIDLKDTSVFLDIKLVHTSDDNFRDTSRLNFTINFSYDFLIIPVEENDKNFNWHFATELYGMDFSFRKNKPIQFGLKYTPIKLGWTGIKNDTLITTEPHIKERYYELSTSLFAYTRFVLSKKTSNKIGLFFDLGAAYVLPYTFKYTFLEDKNTKTMTKRIHNTNDFRVMLRVGYHAVALKAEYHLTKTLKSGYLQQPRLKVGVEFLIPTDS